MEAEAEAEAVDGKLKEAEAKEKLTAVASLHTNHHRKFHLSILSHSSAQENSVSKNAKGTPFEAK